MASQSTRPKTKKRKFDFSDVLEEDVKWFKHTRPPHTQESSAPSATSQVQVMSAAITSATEVPDVQVTETRAAKPPGSPISVPEPMETGLLNVTLNGDAKTPGLDANTIASRSPSVASQEPVASRSRSPSGSSQDAVKPTLKRKVPDDEANVGTGPASSASQPPPQSPTILAPSIARRRTSPPRFIAAEQLEVSEPTMAARRPSSEVLPSPLSSKKKKKKRKGPPGLKFLPDVPIKEELVERPGAGAATDDQLNASGISKGEEEVSEPEAKSRSKTPPPDLTPPLKPSVPPPEPPPQDTESIPTVLAEPAPDCPLDAMLDTVAMAASPDAMEVDAALRPEPNDVSREDASLEVPEQVEGAQEEETSVEEPSHTQDLPLDDDVEMRASSPVPDVAPVEASPASLEPNGVVSIVPLLDVLDSIKVNDIEEVDQHECNDGTKC